MAGLLPFLLGRTLAMRQGVSETEANRIGLVQGMIGLTPLGLLLTQRMIQDAIPAAKSPDVTAPSTEDLPRRVAQLEKVVADLTAAQAAAMQDADGMQTSK